MGSSGKGRYSRHAIGPTANFVASPLSPRHTNTPPDNLHTFEDLSRA